MSSDATSDLYAHFEELSEARQRKDRGAEIDALLAIANENLVRGDPNNAGLHYALAARRIQDAGVRFERLHEALGGHARSMRKQERYHEALDLFKRAEKAAREHVGVFDAAFWMTQQGAVRRLTDETAAAHEVLDRADEILRMPRKPERRLLTDFAEGSDPKRLRALAELEGQRGLLALATNAQEEAEESYRRALDFAEAGNDLGAVNTWGTNLGNACRRRRSYAQAEKYYEVASAAARRIGDGSRLLNTAWNRSNAFLHAHRKGAAAEVLIDAARSTSAPRAQECLELAFDLLHNVCDWTRICEVGGELKEVAASRDADQRHIEDLERRIEHARRRRDEPPEPIHEGPTALDLFIAERMARLIPISDANGALDVADVAHLICDVQLGLPVPDEGAWRAVLSDTSLRHRVVGEAMAALCAQGMPEQSLELSQRYKSVGFALPTLRHTARSNTSHIEAKHYLERLEDLRGAVRALEGPAQADYPRVIEQARAAGEALLEAGELLRERDPVLQARMGGLVQPAELLDALPLSDPVAIVDLFVTGDNTIIHMMVRDGNKIRTIPFLVSSFTAEHVAELIGIWMETGIWRNLGGSQAEGLARIGKLLHDRLFCGLAREVSRLAAQIVLIPDALTRYLPLHLAQVCGKEISIPGVDTESAEYLCEVLPVEYASCLQAVASSQVFKRPRELAKVFSIADPRSDLPAARETSRWLGSRLSEPTVYESLYGEDGTLKELYRGLEDADVVVLGTHGHFAFERPEESYLVCYDGPWKMVSMLDRPVQGRNPVIVLSACEVGAVAVTTDERVASGIPGALISSGAASSVLASLWPVEDVSVGYLIERFLTHLSHPGYRPAAALFRAVRDLRRLPKEDALERCRRYLAEMERAGAADRQIILLDNLIESIEDLDSPYPFTSPIFWGGIVIVGSGWHRPAGAMVGPFEEILEDVNLLLELSQVEDLISNLRFDEARRKAEQLLPQTDGNLRAKALGALARAVWWGRSRWDERSATRRTLKLLGQAERLALVEQDDELVAFLREIRTKVEVEASGGK